MLITGATGRMGQEVVRAVLGANDMELVGAVAADHHGQDIGEVVGVRPVGLPVLDELTPALAAQPEVLVDFTKPDVAGGLAQEALRNGVRPVIGTTALPQADLDAIAELVRETGLSAAIIPNFSIGAVLMMKLAAEVGRFFDHAEIIELHHDQKIDSPSGTALRLQNRVEESMGKECPIHSVRLPAWWHTTRSCLAAWVKRSSSGMIATAAVLLCQGCYTQCGQCGRAPVLHGA